MTAPFNLQYQGISHIFHTVGPTSKSEAALIGCYRTVLECCLTYGVRTIAIPAVATGIFGFPKHQACNIALGTVRAWLEADPTRAARIDTVVFCVWGDDDVLLYKGHLPVYFPMEAAPAPPPAADAPPPAADAPPPADGAPPPCYSTAHRVRRNVACALTEADLAWLTCYVCEAGPSGGGFDPKGAGPGLSALFPDGSG